MAIDEVEDRDGNRIPRLRYGKTNKYNRFPRFVDLDELSDEVVSYVDTKIASELEGFTPGGGSEFAGLYENRVAVVDPEQGDDLTAEFGRTDKPFQRYAGGQGGTSPGSERVLGKIGTWEDENGPLTKYRRALVVFKPGIYEAENLAVKNYIDFYCMPGVIFKGSVTITSQFFADQDGSVEMRMFGHAIFDDSDEPITGKQPFIFLTGANTDIYIEMDRIDSSSCAVYDGGNNSNFTFSCNKIETKSYSNSSGLSVRGYGGRSVINIKNYIRGWSRTYNFRLGEKDIIVNCPENYLSANSNNTGNFEMVIQVDSWGANSTIKFNGDLINEEPAYNGGISAAFNTNAGNGTIEINGNIYGGANRGMYIGTNGGNPTIKMNGNIISDYAAVVLTRGTTIFKNSTLINTNVGLPLESVAFLTTTAKAYFQDCLFYSGGTNNSAVSMQTTTCESYFYNCLYSGANTTGFFILGFVPGINTQIHNTRSTKPLDAANVTDVLSPTGLIVDTNLITPNFI